MVVMVTVVSNALLVVSYIACLEKIVRAIDITKKSININGGKLNHLRFAGDIKW